MKEFCKCEKRDCFANFEPELGGGRRCFALVNNDFKGECPFYKGMNPEQKKSYLKKMYKDIDFYKSSKLAE